jgi:hypothetical protein
VSGKFVSHSSTDNAPAIALRDWLVGEGWDDLFLDLDPEWGIAAGERWERALKEGGLGSRSDGFFGVWSFHLWSFLGIR